MHLVFYINSLTSGGAERVMAKLANHFVTQGHTLDLVTQTSYTEDRYPVDARINRISTASGALSNSLISALFSNVTRARRLRSILKRRKPDAVVAFMPTANVVALMAKLGTNIPVIISERVHPPFAVDSSARRWLQRLTYPKATRVVVLAEESAAYLRAEFDLQAVTTIPNSVSLPLPQSTPQIQVSDVLQGDRKIMLFVGRMVEQKQPMLVLETFLRLHRQHPDWRLVMIGDGPLGEQIDAAITSTESADYICRMPKIGNIEDWYRAAHIFVLFSLFEGSPNALLEAMACGCTVVATDCSTGPRELIDDHVNGVLVPLRSDPNYDRHLEELMVDEVLREGLATAATGVMEQFNDEAFFERWEQTILQASNTRL